MKYKLRKQYTTNPEFALSEILQDRGVADIENFLYPTDACELNPYDLNNIEEGAKMLLKHLNNDNKILIVVDADADGYCSASILWLYIKSIYPDANLYFTVHEHKQHGLNDKIDWIEDSNENFDLILVPDAGSYECECHQRLNNMKIDVLVLDHHAQLLDDNGEPIISDYPNVVIINNQLSPNYRNKSLCGAGVVYKFCEVLDNILRIERANDYIDLVALGEIADVMDRTNTETNYLMIKGLKNIQNKGFKTLIESQSFSLKEKAVFPYNGLTAIDIAFYIAPLINAITRVGTMQEKINMFYCFVEPDKVVQSTKRGAKPGDIEYAAEQTARVGKNAKARQDKIKEKAADLIDFKIQKNDLLQNNIILIELDEEDDIPQELTGLIAMGAVSKYHKPCMIGRRNSRNEIQGSIRSDSNFIGLPSFKNFLENSKLVDYVAGHDGAAGFTIKDTQVTNLLSYSNLNLNATDFENCYIIDYILDAKNDNYQLLRAIAAHPEFFGNHIDEPKIVIKNIPLTNINVMGADRSSIKISYNGINYVKFKDTDFIEKIMSDSIKKINVYGRVNLNEWMGKQSVQIFISDYELVEDNSKYEF